MVAIGIVHFVIPAPFVSIVPRSLPAPFALVIIATVNNIGTKLKTTFSTVASAL